MTAFDNHVCPKVQSPTDTEARNLISAAMLRFSADRGIDVAARDLSCNEKTVRRARDKDTLLSAETVIGLFWNDRRFRETLLSTVGERPVPVEAKCDTDALPSVSGAVHHLAVAQSPDSPGGARITDGECLEIEGGLDRAMEALGALKARCHAIRAGRAA